LRAAGFELLDRFSQVLFVSLCSSSNDTFKLELIGIVVIGEYFLVNPRFITRNHPTEVSWWMVSGQSRAACLRDPPSCVRIVIFFFLVKGFASKASLMGFGLAQLLCGHGSAPAVGELRFSSGPMPSKLP
jgi:hypothetical protein